MAVLNLVHFSKKSNRLSSTGSEILTFGSHCSANFQPILDCFTPKFRLEYDDSENIKTDRVNAVVFNLHQIKRLKFFLGHPVYSKKSLIFDLRTILLPKLLILLYCLIAKLMHYQNLFTELKLSD